MKPIEFITHVEQYNESFGKRMEAMKKNIAITDGLHNYRVLSYFLYKGKMVLEIEKVEK